MSEVPEEKPRVLVVDDEKVIRDMLAEFLGMEGYDVHTAEDGVSALSELRRSQFNLILSDLKMPRMGGIALLEEVARTSPDALTVIMTGFGTVETAIDAMKRGAYDYVLKPFKLDEVVHVVQRGLEKQRMSAENFRLREALSLYKVSEAIAASLSLDQVMETIAESLLNEVRVDLYTSFLEDGAGGFVERQSMRGSSGHLRTLPNGLVPTNGSSEHGATERPIHLGTIDHEAVVTRLHETGYILEQGTRSGPFFLTEPEIAPVSFLAVPLRIKQKIIGFLVGVSFDVTHRLEEGQRKLMSIIASRAAAAIENARLYEDLQATFQQTIEGLAKAIDKMDRYTSGHSDRVATYAVRLAQVLGLGPIEVEFVRQSALMHDIGKIGCVLNLNKPGKLTNDEYDAFKKHPVYGRDILDPIKFLHPLIPGVHLHHERWDGRGYPLKMKGNEIPIIARIIAVADTYDAMTSDRSYRRALPHVVAVAEIDRCCGSQFDPEVAHAFTGHIESYRDETRDAGQKVPD